MESVSAKRPWIDRSNFLWENGRSYLCFSFSFSFFTLVIPHLAAFNWAAWQFLIGLAILARTQLEISFYRVKYGLTYLIKYVRLRLTYRVLYTSLDTNRTEPNPTHDIWDKQFLTRLVNSIQAQHKISGLIIYSWKICSV